MPWQPLTSPKRILALSGVLVAIAAAGTVGFAILEDIGFLDSLFTTVVLISTVGMGTAPVTTGGKILAMLVIAGGVGTLVYAVGMIIEFLVGGYLADRLAARSVKRKINEHWNR